MKTSRECSGYKWECPECKAEHGTHGKGGADACDSFEDKACQGLICECEEYDAGDDHGVSMEDPCLEARCFHCGWGGEMPPKPKILKGWKKKAWDAGWRPTGRVKT